jgi:hypothetical protein
MSCISANVVSFCRSLVTGSSLVSLLFLKLSFEWTKVGLVEEKRERERAALGYRVVRLPAPACLLTIIVSQEPFLTGDKGLHCPVDEGMHRPDGHRVWPTKRPASSPDLSQYLLDILTGRRNHGRRFPNLGHVADHKVGVEALHVNLASSQLFTECLRKGDEEALCATVRRQEGRWKLTSKGAKIQDESPFPAAGCKFLKVVSVDSFSPLWNAHATHTLTG